MCRKLFFLISFIFLLGLVLPAIGNAVPNPTYYYKMDEVDGFIVGDSSGNEYDANLVPGDDDVNGIRWDVNHGGCVLFSDSNDSYIEFDPNLGMKTTGGVVSMWIRLANPQSTKGLSGYRFIFGTSPLGDKVQLYMAAYSRWLDLGFGASHVSQTYLQLFAMDRWYHVAVSWDCNAPANADPNDGTLIVYINGAKKRGPSAYTSFKVLTGMAEIGGDTDYHQQAFHGHIDEVAIWDTNLPVADVCDIYYNGVAPYVPSFNVATEPSPGRNEPLARPDKIFSWTPGANAKGHDVYLGIDSNQVNTATRDWPQGVLKVVNQQHTDEVQTITTADEPNGGTYTLTFDGQTTAAIEHNDVAADIDTALEALSNIGSGDIDVSGGPIGAATPIVITFQSALSGQDVGAITIDVTNLTTDGGAAATPTVTETTKGDPGTSWPPDVNLVLDETYYWAVDEVNDSNVPQWPGNVWKFTVNDGKATDPDPEDDDDPDEEDQINRDATLEWKLGDFADEHDVYIGTNFNDVNTATTATAVIYKGRQDSNEYTCSDSNLLTLGEFYYLRVDEVNDTWEPSVVKGDVWAFRAFIGYHLDDFETYTDHTTLRVVWTNRNNAVSPYFRTGGEGHGSQSSMEMKFKDASDGGSAPWFAEVGMQPMQDITFGGLVKALSLWYRCNDTYTNQIYVAVKDGGGKEARVTPSDPNDPNTDGDWHQWNIDFEDFNQPAPNDVDMTNVDMLYLGVGDGTTPYADTGYISFDDIDLYLARCVYDTLHPVGDVEEDCVINWEDIEAMNDDWLDSDYNSTGSDGELHGFTGTNPGWTADGNTIGGRCIYLSGYYDLVNDSNDWVDIDDYALPNFQNRTISLWARSGGQQDRYPYRGTLFGTDDDEYWIEIAIDGGYKRLWHKDELRGGYGYEAENDEDYQVKYPLHTDKLLTDWSHIAMVLHNVYNPSMPTWDGDANTVRVYLYYNGHLAESADTPDRGEIAGIKRHTDNELDGANIGGSDNGGTRFVKAWVDDFRIYDYNMTQPDVCNLWERDDGAVTGDSSIIVWFKFDETSGMIAEDSGKSYGNSIYHELFTSANLVEKAEPKSPYDPANPDIVNLVDYALVADNWLDQQYWPSW